MGPHTGRIVTNGGIANKIRIEGDKPTLNPYFYVRKYLSSDALPAPEIFFFFRFSVFPQNTPKFEKLQNVFTRKPLTVELILNFALPPSALTHDIIVKVDEFDCENFKSIFFCAIHIDIEIRNILRQWRLRSSFPLHCSLIKNSKNGQQTAKFDCCESVK